MLVIPGCPIHIVELYKRCPYPLDLLGTLRDRSDYQLSPQSQAWAWGNVNYVSIEEQPIAHYKAVLLIEPDEQVFLRDILWAKRCMLPGAMLLAISATFLRSFIPDWKREAIYYPGNPLSTRKVINHLTKDGFLVERVIGYHGVRSATWGRIYRIALHAHRPDLADRCLFASRRAFKETGWLAQLTPVALICARIK